MTSALIAHYDNIPFWIPVGTNTDDLECPIHLKLKVRLMDGTLDVGLLQVSDSTICISVARRGGGGLEVLASPRMWAADALFLCGS